MADYRAYLIDADRHFSDVLHLTCNDDAEAISQAERLIVGRAAELWLLDRKVCILPTQKAVP
jgi:hypothetical protein